MRFTSLQNELSIKQFIARKLQSLPVIKRPPLVSFRYRVMEYQLSLLGAAACFLLLVKDLLTIAQPGSGLGCRWEQGKDSARPLPSTPFITSQNQPLNIGAWFS